MASSLLTWISAGSAGSQAQPEAQNNTGLWSLSYGSTREVKDSTLHCVLDLGEEDSDEDDE